MIGLLIAAAANFGGVFMRRFWGGNIALDVQHAMRTELFDSLSRLDGARQDEIHTGQLVGRSISDLNMVQGLLQMVPLSWAAWSCSSSRWSSWSCCRRR